VVRIYSGILVLPTSSLVLPSDLPLQVERDGDAGKSFVGLIRSFKAASRALPCEKVKKGKESTGAQKKSFNVRSRRFVARKSFESSVSAFFFSVS
jgi:hypothetical protein